MKATTTREQIAVIDDIETANLLMNPIRMEILSRLKEPDSAVNLSRQLGLTRQKVNYHLRKLEGKSLVKKVGEEKRRNCIERIMQSSSLSYIISPETLGKLNIEPSIVKDHFSSAYLIAVLSESIKELSALRKSANLAKKKLSTLTIESEIRFSSADQMGKFKIEVSEMLAVVIKKYHDDEAEEGRNFKLMLSSYPKQTNSNSE